MARPFARCDNAAMPDPVPSSEIQRALDGVPTEQRAWMDFLVAHMPESDRTTLSADFLLEHVAWAAQVRHETPVGMEVPEEIFREYVLPYAHLDERRDPWRRPLFERFVETARRAASIEDAARTLNRMVFESHGVTFHATRRPHDNQSPFEVLRWGFASCTGLSILLASAYRAVGLPARVVGTPMWADESGNHSWVEVWDHGEWHFLGASEPGPYDLTWFNDLARRAGPGHGIYAARWSPGTTHFPLFWSPAYEGVPADDVTERYRSVEPTPPHPTRIETAPRRYLCPKVERPIELTGAMDDPQWADVPWTDDFVDIEGHRKPTPRFRTRAKMCWDDEHLYVGALLETPHVWGTLTEKNAILFSDPDFEVFLDPDGDHHHYYELEINALGTIWELYLERPYRDGGPVHRGANLPGLRTAVKVHGTLNDPSDQDEGWSVEVAIPFADLQRFCRGTRCPPEPGDVWRLNMSRVDWLADVVDGGYRKVPRDAHPEDNWVWTPQMAIDMHRPERWGCLEFFGAAPGAVDGRARRDAFWPARERLMEVYEALRALDEPLLDAAALPPRGVPDPSLGELSIERDGDGWIASVPVTLAHRTRHRATITSDGCFAVEPLTEGR
jgi:hypothetical protein